MKHLINREVYDYFEMFVIQKTFGQPCDVPEEKILEWEQIIQKFLDCQLEMEAYYYDSLNKGSRK